MKKHILIIGGGYTGLTAAWRLAAEPDVQVTLVESAPQLGGLAGGFPLADTSLEKTYHHLFLTDRDILQVVGELGLQDKLVWCDSSVGIYRDGRIHSFKTPGDLLAYRPCSLTGRIRTGVAALYLKHTRNWRKFTRQTAHDWMTRACGESAMKSIWTPLLKGKFDRYYRDVSMAWFWARIHTRANSRAGGGGEKLGYFRGGFQVLTRQWESVLRQQGVRLITGTTVERLGADKTAVVGGQAMAYDACIFTGPSPALARLLPAEPALQAYAEQLRSIQYLGAACLVFTSEQSLGEFYWVNINEPDAPFLVFIQHTRLMGPENYGGRHVYYIGAYLDPAGRVYNLSEAELAELWLGYLKRMYPAFQTSQIRERHLFRFPAAQHIVDTDYEARIPAYQTPLAGVYLANFSQVFPEDRGTNFAVREGEKIARLVGRDLGLPSLKG